MILDWPKLKAFADDKIDVTEKLRKRYGKNDIIIKIPQWFKTKNCFEI